MIQMDWDDDVTTLHNRWGFLHQTAWEGEFDYACFKTLAAHTFSYLYPLRTQPFLMKESVPLLLRISEFAVMEFSDVKISPEFDAAKIVAYELCEQTLRRWVESPDPENIFVVTDGLGRPYLIDTNTFDLTELAAGLG